MDPHCTVLKNEEHAVVLLNRSDVAHFVRGSFVSN